MAAGMLPAAAPGESQFTAGQSHLISKEAEIAPTVSELASQEEEKTLWAAKFRKFSNPSPAKRPESEDFSASNSPKREFFSLKMASPI